MGVALHLDHRQSHGQFAAQQNPEVTDDREKTSSVRSAIADDGKTRHQWEAYRAALIGRKSESGTFHFAASSFLDFPSDRVLSSGTSVRLNGQNGGFGCSSELRR